MARKPPKGKSVADLNPDLAKQWHTSKNGDLTPLDVTYSSGSIVWWKCSKDEDHEWEAKISNRNNGTGCPLCPRFPKAGKSFADKNPHLINEWHSTKNGDITPYDVTSNSGRKFWWKCSKAIDHEWEASVDNRAKGKGCPCCSGRKAVKSNCLATTHPEIAKQWHPTKNGNIYPSSVLSQTNHKYWWQCEHGHEWETSIKNRTNKNSGCPNCFNLQQ